MSYTVKNILLWTTAAILIAGMVFVGVFAAREVEEPTCNVIHISILDQEERQYISEQEVRSYLLNQGVTPIGKKDTDVPCQQIEDIVRKHPLIRTAECYQENSGDVCIRLTQREPVLMVKGEESYYIDSDRKMMPIQANVTASVPIVTGHIGRRMASEEMYDFAIWLNKNAYWKNEIRHIYVRGPHDVVLIQHSSGCRLDIGDIRDAEKNLKKLRKLYEDGIEKMNNKPEYTEIDLRYEGQAVGRK